MRLPRREFWVFRCAYLAANPGLLDAFFVLLALHDAVHINSGEMDVLRFYLARLHDLLDLHDTPAAGLGGHPIKVVRGALGNLSRGVVLEWRGVVLEWRVVM